MLSAINYHITQLNRFHCVLDQNKLKSTHLALYWENNLVQLLINVNISETNCNGDLKRQMRKYYANANMLLRKFSYCSPDAKCCMCKSYCSTTYCSSMWFDSTVTSMTIAYNNGFRRLLNLTKYNSASQMFINLNIPSFGEQLRKFVFRFRKRIINSDNSLVHGIVNSASPLFSKYGLGGVIFLTHIKCTYVLGLSPFFYIDLYIDTF